MKKNIYLARQDGTNLYKIGITKKKPEVRIKELQTGNGTKLIVIAEFVTAHGFKMETALHEVYKSKKVHLEWFELEDEDVSLFLDYCEKKEEAISFLKKHNHFWQNI